MIGKIIAINLITLSLSLVSPSVVSAVAAPLFPSCLNPSGPQKVEYVEGTHGVPGRFVEYRGSDRVYTVSETQILQCMCQDDGYGVQTNWWKIPELSEDELNNFKSLGWVYVPDGQIWGLDATAYLALNVDYQCSGRGGGDILATSTERPAILGLAATGDKLPMWYLLDVGLSALLGGAMLRRINRSENP